ncbi:MAG: peptidoglycan-associated lipoprotein Pal [Acidobacteriota bacterium]|jgi:peptidoglycan-associated lipoprotein|nr:peptidoglycan-associated lipoprotein Pal [Acidobacteriota bacterium]
MRRPRFQLTSTALAALTLAGLMILATGCGKKAGVPIPSDPRAGAGKNQTADGRPPMPSPTVTIKAEPSSVEKGKATTLTWETTNATGVTIDNGIGTVEASGSRTVRPMASTTYKIRATNNVAVAAAEIRVTVTDADSATPPPSSLINDAAFFDSSMQDVFFALDEFTVNGAAQRILQANARALAERPNILITVEGYCDERGSERYNLVLGDKRANAVRDYLISLGIAANRIEAVSYGEERPFCEEHTEECWQSNRRASIVMR